MQSNKAAREEGSKKTLKLSVSCVGDTRSSKECERKKEGEKNGFVSVNGSCARV